MKRYLVAAAAAGFAIWPEGAEQGIAYPITIFVNHPGV